MFRLDNLASHSSWVLMNIKVFNVTAHAHPCVSFNLLLCANTYVVARSQTSMTTSKFLGIPPLHEHMPMAETYAQHND